MTSKKQDDQYPRNSMLGILAGMLVGGLAGALTMLLLAPQSGRDTRMQIQKKGVELRGRASEMVEDTVAQVRSKANKITMSIKNYGKEQAVDQLDQVSDAAQAGKKALQSS